ncbi:Crinkler (CRN) [Phytophthora megakarya]|uniref:Crinkler (CRN) n=1 Tax=Phytophthora megakarya TaxID=4795 RepID=A0A225UYI4_9STRA|nr:Crinkler (CRN) [Phytophthora megakarya]
MMQSCAFTMNCGGKNVIGKFAKRYGEEVHRFCSNAGFAPKLLVYEGLPNDWVFVVMEQLRYPFIKPRSLGHLGQSMASHFELRMQRIG